MSAKKAPSSSKRIMTAIILVSFASMLALPTAIVVFVGMIPSYLAWFSDREKGRLTAITVGAINMAALTFILATLWDRGHTMRAAIELVSSPFTWALMLVGALLGWVMAQVIPMIIVGVITARNKSRLERIRARQAQLVNDWGQGVTEIPSGGKTL